MSDYVENWLGQKIRVGDWVYRGAREGNGSSFKIGKVDRITDGRVRVRWHFIPGFFGDIKKYFPRERWDGLVEVQKVNTVGSPAVESLVILDNVDTDRLENDANRWGMLQAELRNRQLDTTHPIV